MASWNISRDMNFFKSNVISFIKNPVRSGKNPAATPSALQDWGFVIMGNPDTLTEFGMVFNNGEITWEEAVLLALSKRNASYGQSRVKPIVLIAIFLDAVKSITQEQICLTKHDVTQLMQIDDYEDLSHDAILSILNSPHRFDKDGFDSTYLDIWYNALAETPLFYFNKKQNKDDAQFLYVNDSTNVWNFIADLAANGSKIKLCPSKESNRDDYYEYMGSPFTGITEMLNDFKHKESARLVCPTLYLLLNKGETKDIITCDVVTTPRQVIYYGAPGTGKSHTTDRIIEKFPDSHQRTTFHPDTDYSSFVGCYKPTEKGGKLTYKFVPQVFLKAYVEAWRNPASPYFLVIEEINRGNCAQIFGDIFQLLDRDNDKGGISKYSITPDEDIRKYLEETFVADEFDHLPESLRKGERMQLPGNLYILATMNTSDQSLFPIDSAFKRRWAWKYKPIEQGRDKEGKLYEWLIRNGNYAYDWWQFIDKINKKIEDLTHSEDKKMGFWFTRPEKGVGYITLEDFISKVLFYLWNDVFKDLARTDETIFKGRPEKADGAADDPKPYEIFFTHFFRADGSVETLVRDFMRFNDITEKEFVEAQFKDDEDGGGEPTEHLNMKGGKRVKYVLDGVQMSSIHEAYVGIFKWYMSENPEISAEQAYNNWRSIADSMNIPVRYMILTQQEYDGLMNYTTKDKRFDRVSVGDTNFYLTNQWTNEAFDSFRSALEQHGLHPNLEVKND